VVFNEMRHAASSGRGLIKSGFPAEEREWL
jgi:hypothetical protein